MDDLIDRYSARRIFGATLEFRSVGGPRQIGELARGPADGFAIGETKLGGATSSFRQQPGERSPLAGPPHDS